jgi:hypothetical protein
MKPKNVGTDAYRMGFEAFRSGELSNPFSETTYFGKEWVRGFNKAYFLNLEKINAEKVLTPRRESDIIPA